MSVAARSAVMIAGRAAARSTTPSVVMRRVQMTVIEMKKTRIRVR